jgi:TonB-linked SusC/RagA family outer membrane protein
MKRMTAVFICLMAGMFAMGQTRQLSGVVLDAASSQGIVSATIKVAGKSAATTTNADGQFSFTVPTGKISLEVSSVGFVTKSVSVGEEENNISVSLATSTTELSEVVVTALGITKQRKALNYTVVELKTEDLTKARTNNIMNGLAGKVPGVNITSTATGAAGSSRVVIRGNSSLNGASSPLYVIDGVPIDNSNRGSAGEWGGQDAGDGIQSINPDEVETVTVLKGGQAAALYGSRASNGVILITTKKGSKRRGASIEINSNFAIENPTSFTDWQYVYGHGVNGAKPQTADEAASLNLNSWGAKLDGSSVIQYDGVSRPYSAVKDNMKNFYETGTNLTNSVSLSGGSDKAIYYFTASDLNNKSFIPNSTLRRNNLSLNTTFNPIDNLSLNVSIRYIRERVKNRPKVSDSPGNANFSVFLLPTNMDVRTLKESMTNPDGSERKWQGNDYVTNPYWATDVFKQNDDRDRFIGSVEGRYSFTNWLYLRGRLGADQYTTSNFAITPYGTKFAVSGQLDDQSKLTSGEFNAEGILGANKTFGDFGFDAFAGVNKRIARDEKVGVNGNTFFGPNFYDQSNLANKNPYYQFSKKIVNSVFGSAEFSFRKYLYVTVTGRNDWFSSLSPENWSIFYPSVGGTFIVSDAVKMPSWVNFLKVRGSWAKIGADSDPYKLLLTYRYNNPPYGSLPVAGIAQGDIPNALLKPYKIFSSEFGFEAKALNNRVGIDLTFYQRTTKDDIVASSLSQASGFNSIVLNVGEIRNKGVELLLMGTPVKNKDLTWDVNFNFGYNKSKVVDLNEGLERIRVGQARSLTAFIDNVVGQEYGQISGYRYKRNAGGQLLLNGGLPQRDGNLVNFGTGIAPWTLGLTNDFHYKDFSLSVLVDGKFGGLVYSGTNDFATYRGVSKETLNGREGFVADGIDEASGLKNTTNVTAQSYYQTVGLNITEDFIYKSDFIKLRQIILGYQLPNRLFKGTPFKSIALSFFGRNLAILKKYTPNVDPESTYTAGPAQGLEWFGAPPVRSFGVNLNVKF